MALPPTRPDELSDAPVRRTVPQAQLYARRSLGSLVLAAALVALACFALFSFQRSLSLSSFDVTQQPKKTSFEVVRCDESARYRFGRTGEKDDPKTGERAGATRVSVPSGCWKIRPDADGSKGLVEQTFQAPVTTSERLASLACLLAALASFGLLYPGIRSVLASRRAQATMAQGDLVNARIQGDQARQWASYVFGIGSAVGVAALLALFLSLANGQVRTPFFRFSLMTAKFGEVMGHFAINVKIFVITEIFVLIWGLMVAVGRLAPGKAGAPVRWLAIFYIDLFRGIPAVITLTILNFGLKKSGIPFLSKLDDFWYAVIALTLTYGAYVAEVYRSGIESIHWSRLPPPDHSDSPMRARCARLLFRRLCEELSLRCSMTSSVFKRTRRSSASSALSKPSARPASSTPTPSTSRPSPWWQRSSTSSPCPRPVWSIGLSRGIRPRRGEEAEMSNFIEMIDVQKQFGANQVLRGVNLNVDQHQVVCLIGPSGCGKSTLLRCINALEVINGGEIRIDGDRVSGPGIDVNALRADVGIVFQSFNLFPHKTVMQNVTLAPVKVLGMEKAAAEDRAMALLKRIGLDHKATEYPDRLSGGQQQRVAIARALAMQPRVMLLDEITSALDPELVSEVLNIVRDLAAEGMTMLLATHEMGFAKEVASKVCFLYEGVVHEEGPPEQLFGDPHEERTRAFLKSIIEAGRL